MSKLEQYQQRAEAILESVLAYKEQQPLQQSRLRESMRYSVLEGGKRVRPILVYATGEALNVPLELLDKPAAAIELIHVYSLIHDDLPAMDDDDLRRGKATAHIAFDEATAILSGDALQTLAFEILSQEQPLQHALLQRQQARSLHKISAKNQLKIISILSTAAGMRGMVEGQAIDLAAVGKTLNERQLENMHHHKTGALIRASVHMASYCTDSATQEQRNKLLDYAEAIGLAFQVHDDILDIESDTETLGKQQGADIAAGKPTYPSIIGLDAAKLKAKKLYQDALDALSDFGPEADLLREIAGFIVKRLS